MTIAPGNAALNSFGSTITLDTFNNRVFSHEVFGISKRFTIAAGAVMNIVIDPTENGTFLKSTFVFLPLSISAHGGGPVNIDIYAGTDSDADGTEWVATDRNFIGPVTPHTVVRHNPTINTAGVLSPVEDRIESAAGVGVHADTGGQVKGDFLFVPRSDIRYMVRLTNTDVTNPATGVFAFNYFEV